MSPLSSAEREVEALLESVRFATGMDLRGYARTALRRRLESLAVRTGLGVAALHARAIADPARMAELAAALCLNVTALFRDPDFYVAYRLAAVPRLRDHGPVRAWHAGCATGEEVWSNAIVLREEGLAAHALLFGTDISAPALARARAGALPMDRMREYTAAYHRAGGSGDFSEYYVADARFAVVRPFLRDAARFGRHDLTADPAFGPFDVVFCRNVLIYLEPPLQDRVHQVLAGSLRPGGILALGHGEVLSASVRGAYAELDAREKIFLRLG